MTIETIQTQAFEGQKPGTSGLRKKVTVFQAPHYLENFVQSIFDIVSDMKGGTLILGGDGRYHNEIAIQTIIKMARANGVAKIIVGQGGLLSTPAVSHLIRKYGATGGIILSASHNAAGPDGDFGIKYNGANGGPAPESITNAIYAKTQNISEYKLANLSEIDLSQLGRVPDIGMDIQIIDPVEDYADLMEDLFDFTAIEKMIASGFTLCFDAMNAITGPYAQEIFETRLKAKKGSVINAVPLKDFGGGHPDPNPVYAKPLFDLMFSNDSPDFGAASDGDGDRHIVLGRDIYISPSDGLAVLTANAHLAPAYKDGISGVARSMPTSRAADRVAQKIGVEYFETPTGWKFFGNLLDAGRITLCGEESAGASSDHIREKDGIWAVLLWLNIIAARGQGVAEIMQDHWTEFGRNFYSRHDYEDVETDKAHAVMDHVRGQLANLPGQTFDREIVSKADSFSYHDPVDGSVSDNQGLRVEFESGSRFVVRLSGTGTVGATLRLYVERYSSNPEHYDTELQDALSEIINIAQKITNIKTLTGRSKPSLVS